MPKAASDNGGRSGRVSPAPECASEMRARKAQAAESGPINLTKELTMNICPVANDLCRHLAEDERRDARIDAIVARADELIASGDLDALVNEMSALDADKFYKGLALLCGENTPLSRNLAILDIRHALLAAATKLAERQLREEADAAEEAWMVSRYEARMEDWT